MLAGDAERLRQVLRNVVGNALQHTPPGTRVRLSLVAAEGMATVEVADSGPGVPAVHLPKIFDRFYRVDVARSRMAASHASGRTTGTGLGLAIVRHLVEAHDGSATLDSPPGEGTTVTLRLPLAHVRDLT